jgi:phage/plasmid-associated DNA primase
LVEISWVWGKLYELILPLKAERSVKTAENPSASITNRAIQCGRDYFELDGLKVPPIIQAEIDRCKREQDSIVQFIEEDCETYEQARAADPDHYLTPGMFTVRNSDLYRAYKSFCANNGEYLRSRRRVTQILLERGFRRINSGSEGGR